MNWLKIKAIWCFLKRIIKSDAVYLLSLEIIDGKQFLESTTYDLSEESTEKINNAIEKAFNLKKQV